MTLTLVCGFCGEVFSPNDAQGITILGPGFARYGCPNPECDHVVRSRPPAPNTSVEEAPIPAIVPIDDSSGDEND